MEWSQAFMAFLTANNIPIDGVSGQGANAQIWYTSAATPAQIAFAEAAKLTFVVPPQPDVEGYKVAIIADTNIPTAVQVELCTFSGAITDLVNSQNWTALQTLWAATKQSSSAIAAAASEIETVAKAHNIPLVAQ